MWSAACTCKLLSTFRSFLQQHLKTKMLNALWKQAVMHLTISGTYQCQELLPHCPEFMFSLQYTLHDTDIHSSGARSQRGEYGYALVEEYLVKPAARRGCSISMGWALCMGNATIHAIWTSRQQGCMLLV